MFGSGVGKGNVMLFQRSLHFYKVLLCPLPTHHGLISPRHWVGELVSIMHFRSLSNFYAPIKVPQGEEQSPLLLVLSAQLSLKI